LHLNATEDNPLFTANTKGKDRKDKTGAIAETWPAESTPASLPEVSSGFQFPKYDQVETQNMWFLSQINS